MYRSRYIYLSGHATRIQLQIKNKLEFCLANILYNDIKM